MANQPIYSPKQYRESLRKLEVTDPVHANVVNPLLEQLINNDAFLRDMQERLVQNAFGNFVAAPAGTSALQFTFSDLTATWTGGPAYVNGRLLDVQAGSIELNPNQEQYIYLDTDGTMKKTTSQATAEAGLLLWYFATDASQVITSTDKRNILNLDAMTIDPTLAPTGNTGRIRNLLSGLANMIKKITGKVNWWDAPRTTLENAVKLNGDTMTGPLTVPQLIAGDGTSGPKVYIGDDAVIEDFNTENAMRIVGRQNPAIAELYLSTNNFKVWREGNLTSVAGTTLYVDPNGSDNNDGLTTGTALKTINEALRRIPKILWHDFIIRLASGTYNEIVRIHGYHGHGRLHIIGQAYPFTSTRSYKLTGLDLHGNVCPIAVEGVAITGSRITVSLNKWFSLFGVVNEVSNLGDTAIAVSASHGMLRDCELKNHNIAIHAFDASYLYVLNCIGTGNNYGLKAEAGSIIAWAANQPQGTTANQVQETGGRIYS